jgi:hypothetical protein
VEQGFCSGLDLARETPPAVISLSLHFSSHPRCYFRCFLWLSPVLTPPLSSEKTIALEVVETAKGGGGTQSLGRHSPKIALHSLRPISNFTHSGTAAATVGDDASAGWGQTNGDALGGLADYPVMHVIFERFATGRQNNVDLSFQFAITEHDDKAIVDRQNCVAGHMLLFFRNGQQSIAEWHLGPFMGMFPIPVVNFDFGWVTENWEHLMTGRNRVREFDKSVE